MCCSLIVPASPRTSEFKPSERSKIEDPNYTNRGGGVCRWTTWIKLLGDWVTQEVWVHVVYVAVSRIVSVTPVLPVNMLSLYRG